jgi:hypothetical protein
MTPRDGVLLFALWAALVTVSSRMLVRYIRAEDRRRRVEP